MMNASERDFQIVSVILRLGIASLFFASAVGKFIGGRSGLVSYFSSLFQSTWLPSFVVTATAYTTPYIESLLAIALIFGLRLRTTWACAAVYMIILAFGMTIAQKYDVASSNFLYVLMFAVGLLLARHDRFVLLPDIAPEP